MIYDITPCTKPRMTRSDKWKKRPCVMRYRAFKDHCNLLKVTVKSGDSIIFNIPMPKSWSKKKRIEMNGTPHMKTPDIDNLTKALLDAIHKNDSHIWHLTLQKIWSNSGSIEIE